MSSSRGWTSTLCKENYHFIQYALLVSHEGLQLARFFLPCLKKANSLHSDYFSQEPVSVRFCIWNVNKNLFPCKRKNLLFNKLKTLIISLLIFMSICIFFFFFFPSPYNFFCSVLYDLLLSSFHLGGNFLSLQLFYFIHIFFCAKEGLLPV